MINHGYEMNAIFNRYERKYLINNKQQAELVAFLKEHLAFDPYSADGQPYTIYNLYYDTDDFSVIRSSINKPIYKEKLRLRCYHKPSHDGDIVFLEMKKKYAGRINKRRLALSYKDARAYIKDGWHPAFSNYMDAQAFKEIDYFVNVHHARPSVLIKYNRLAFHSVHDNLRVTFDNMIDFIGAIDSLDQETQRQYHAVLAEPGLSIMEIKSSLNFPLWLVRRLSKLELFSQPFSKYGKAYQHYLSGGATDDHMLYDT